MGGQMGWCIMGGESSPVSETSGVGPARGRMPDWQTNKRNPVLSWLEDQDLRHNLCLELADLSPTYWGAAFHFLSYVQPPTR